MTRFSRNCRAVFTAFRNGEDESSGRNVSEIAELMHLYAPSFELSCSLLVNRKLGAGKVVHEAGTARDE